MYNQSQDISTIANLLSSSQDRLFRYALSLCKTIDRADDLVQETFLRALRHANTLHSMNAFQCDAWLKRVLRNRFFDEQRAHKRARAALLEGIRSARRSSDVTGQPTLCEILDQVPSRYRGALERKYRLGMNSTEIGAELGLPAATVRSHIHQGIQWLRNQMEDSIQ